MEKHMSTDVIRAFASRRFALVASVAISLFTGVSAYAQNPRQNPAGNNPQPAAAATPASAPGAAEAERVVVTGSNIPTAEEVTAAPVDTLNTQEIQRSGQGADVLNILQRRNPDFTGGGNLGTSNANIASNFTQGGSQIQIRGFPTLVLYEGRRIADSAAIASGNIQFTDVSIFPAALISRIEVLKDGASAIYGSEAVGGVVNIFTKDDFQGAEVGFRYGTALNEAVAERRGYAIAGVGNETTQITVGMQYYEIDPLFQRQVGYSASAINGTTNYAGAARDGNDPSGTAFYLAKGEDPLHYPGPIVANSPFNVGVTPGSIAPGAGFAGIPQFYAPATFGQVLSFNLANAPTNTLDQSRTNVIATADHQIFGKQLEIFGNFLYLNSDSQQLLNAQPLNNTTGVVILGSERVDPVTGALVPENRGTPAPFNPFVESIDQFSASGPDLLQIANRFISKPRITDYENNLYRFLGGIRSQITPDWTAEVAAYYSKYDNTYVNTNLVNATVLNQFIEGKDANGNPVSPLDFFAFNPVGTGPGQLSSTEFNSIFGANIREASSFQRVFDGKLTGFPFELPGGKIGISVGAEFRQEGFKITDSPEIFVGSVPIQNIDVKRDIYSFFGELNVPIVGSSMNVPGVYNLEVTLAGRYDHYKGVSEDAKVPKVELRYQPIKDLTLRATYSNSFIAPNLFQTNGPVASGFSSGITLNGVTQDQAQVESGSNPNLVPSTAESYTAGIVYSPSFVPGLTITADYFRTLQQQIVSTLGGELILTSVNNLGPASPYASLVAFNNFPGLTGSRPVTAPGQLFQNLVSVFYIDNLRNLGAQHAEGFDLSAHYTLDLKTFGQLELGVNAIVFTEYEAKILPSDQYYNLLGLDQSESLGGLPDYKLTFLTEYRWQGFSASLIANYIPKMYNANGQDPVGSDFHTFQKIGDYLEFDGRLSYTFVRNEMPGAPAPEPKDSKSMRDGKNTAPAPVPGSTMSIFDRMLNGTTLAVGCNNIFDRVPPFVEQANGNTDLSLYDPYGRFLYFEISKKF
jgi:iron complex outermembrane recepter protein